MDCVKRSISPCHLDIAILSFLRVSISLTFVLNFRFFLQLSYGFSTLNITITITILIVDFNLAVLIATPLELSPPTMSSKTFTVSAALCLALVFSPATALAAPQMVSLLN